MIGGAAALAAALLARLALGSVVLPIGDTLRVLLGAAEPEAISTRIIIQFRLPRALTALVAGAGLSAAGTMMQTLFRNPLAGPAVLGVNAGASLGVALVVLAGSTFGARVVGGTGLVAALSLGGDAVVTTSAVLGAALVMLFVLLVSTRIPSALTLLVLGVLFSYAVNAVVSVLMHFSIPEEIQSYIYWTFGSFAGVSTVQLPLVVGVVGFGLALTLLFGKPLNAMLLGETYARTMGVRVVGVRVAVIAITALLAGTITAFCGPIAFVGIAVPHLTRALLHTADHRLLLPAVMLIGSIVAMVSDLASSLPGLELTLPLNAITAIVGAPVVILVITRRGGVREAFR
ncbi:MAG: iron chelate uptake ABC transporter family permease subunit [Spirochaetales bacterium]